MVAIAVRTLKCGTNKLAMELGISDAQNKLGLQKSFKKKAVLDILGSFRGGLPNSITEIIRISSFGDYVATKNWLKCVPDNSWSCFFICVFDKIVLYDYFNLITDGLIV
ncbi:UNVERIFIED_CONTAM: hypothetical protein K2H54_074408 [Gekko kuhli]